MDISNWTDHQLIAKMFRDCDIEVIVRKKDDSSSYKIIHTECDNVTTLHNLYDEPSKGIFCKNILDAYKKILKGF